METPARAGAGRMSTDAAHSPLLQVEHCTLKFGGLTAVSDLSLQLSGPEIVGLIGTNGAGKTPVFNPPTEKFATAAPPSSAKSPGKSLRTASPARSRISAFFRH